LAEWSNATDLSSVSFGSAGSNPAGCNSKDLDSNSNPLFENPMCLATKIQQVP
jgi:hypothetical protein